MEQRIDTTLVYIDGNPNDLPLIVTGEEAQQILKDNGWVLNPWTEYTIERKPGRAYGQRIQ